MLGLMLVFLMASCYCLSVQIETEKTVVRIIFAIVGFVCLVFSMSFADKLDKSMPKEPTPICECHCEK